MVSLKLPIQNQRNSEFLSAGFLLLETLISITIFAIFILFFVASFNNIFATQDASWKRTQASLYAQEGLEISYNIFTNTTDWTALVRKLKENPVHHPNLDKVPGFLPAEEKIDGFTRQLTFEDVYRVLSTHEISTQPPTDQTYFDPDTLLVRSQVKWVAKGGEQSVEYVTYITRGQQQ